MPGSTFAGAGATTITSPREIAGSMEPPTIPTMWYQGLPTMPRSMNTIAASATTTATLTTMRRDRPMRPRRVRGVARSTEATAARPRKRSGPGCRSSGSASLDNVVLPARGGTVAPVHPGMPSWGAEAVTLAGREASGLAPAFSRGVLGRSPAHDGADHDQEENDPADHQV